jgi:hypothetical protein
MCYKSNNYMPPPIIILKTVTVIIQKFDCFFLKLVVSLPPPKTQKLG